MGGGAVAGVIAFSVAGLFVAGCFGLPAESGNHCGGFYTPSRSHGQGDSDQDGQLDSVTLYLKLQGTSSDSNLTLFVNVTLEKPLGHVVASNRSGPLVVRGQSQPVDFNAPFVVPAGEEAGNFTLNYSVNNSDGRNCMAEAYVVFLYPPATYNGTWVADRVLQTIGPGEIAYYNLSLRNVGTGGAYFSIGSFTNDSNWEVIRAGPTGFFLHPGESLNISVRIEPYVHLPSGSTAYTNITGTPGNRVEYAAAVQLVTTYVE